MLEVNMKRSQKVCLTVTLIIGMMFIASIFTLQGSLLTSLIAHYELSDSEQGFASSAACAGGVVALMSSFFLIGHIPKLLLLRIGVAVCSVFLALLKFSPSFSLFVVMWFAIGIGLGYMDMLVSSCMADLYEGRAATSMMCILHMSYGVVSSLVPFLYDAMLKRMMWNSLYLWVAGLGILLLVLFTVSVAYARSCMKREPMAENRMSFREMGEVMKKGALPALVAAMFCHGVFLGGLNTWINRYVSVTLNSSFGSLSLSLMFVGVLVSRLVISLTNISAVKFIRFAGYAAAACVFVALPFRSGALMCAGILGCGLFFGAMIPCILDVGCAATPESTMFATTSMVLSLYLGEAIIPPVIGALEAAFNLHVGIALCGVFMVIASVCCSVAKIPKDIR